MASTDVQNMVPRDINSHMVFLSRNELYQTEKPYATDFPVDEIEGAKVSNHTFDTVPVTFHDARGVKEPFSLDRNGFCYVKAKTSLQPEDATVEWTEAMDQYMEEVAALLHEKFPHYNEIKPMDFQVVRLRHPTFPEGGERSAEFAQPSTMAHTDFSNRGAWLRMADIFSSQEHCYGNRNWELINVWRVLRGPNNDWPLAMCDYRHVDTEKDVTSNDSLHYSRVGENSLLYHSDTHRWYYLSDMQEDDLIIFRNVDSEEKKPRAFHGSFHNPDAAGEFRHSVEARFVGFFD